MRILSRAFILFVISCLSVAVRGAEGTIEAKDLGGDFQNGAFIVMVANVIEIKDIGNDDRRGNYEIVFSPLATLAGCFDATEAKALRAYGHLRSFGSSILEVPAKGSTVMVVLARFPLGGDPNKVDVFIQSEGCPFMPGASSMVTVDGLGDKRVLETIAKIRKARAEASAVKNGQAQK